MRVGLSSRVRVVAVVTLTGAAMLAGSWFLAATAATSWLSGVLSNLGTAVLLVAPIYLLTKRLDQRIEDVRVESASNVETLTERVATFEGGVERRLEEVAHSVSSRLADERERDLASFDALLGSPSRTTVEETLGRAKDQGLIAARRGPRVCVSEGRQLYVQVDFVPADSREEEDARIGFVVEDFDGKGLDRVEWEPGVSLDDVMVRLGRRLQTMTTGNEFDLPSLFKGLRDMLREAAAAPECRPVLQLCPPQWLVTLRGITTYSGRPRHFELPVSRLRKPNMSAHMASKPWLDRDSYDEAAMVALALIPNPDDPWGSANL